MTQNPNIPEGFVLLANGDLRRRENVDALDMLRHEFVSSLVVSAQALSETMRAHKGAVESELEAFLDQAFAEHAMDYRGNASGITMTTLDGRMRFVVENYETSSVTEEVKAAEQLIREYLEDVSSGVSDDFRKFVRNAFAPSSTGRVSVAKLKNLRHQGDHIADERWRKAMGIIGKAIFVISKKRLFRFYEIDEEGKEHRISLQYSEISPTE